MPKALSFEFLWPHVANAVHSVDLKLKHLAQVSRRKNESRKGLCFLATIALFEQLQASPFKVEIVCNRYHSFLLLDATWVLDLTASQFGTHPRLGPYPEPFIAPLDLVLPCKYFEPEYRFEDLDEASLHCSFSGWPAWQVNESEYLNFFECLPALI